MAIITGSSSNDFIHRTGDGHPVPFGFIEVTGVTIFADSISGLGGTDIIYGDAGNDTIDGGTGDDSIAGGTGNDLYIADSLNDTISENGGQGNDTVQSSVDWTLATNVESLTLTGSALRGTGNSLSNFIVGNAANNLLYGGTGNDTLSGDTGDDVLNGSAGADDLRGSFGRDTASYSLASAGVDASLQGPSFNAGEAVGDTYSSIECILGSSFGDSLVGNALGNTLNGQSGDDFLEGGAGDDGLIGGSGNDVFFVDSLGDIVVEFAGQGTDEVISAVDYELGDNLENLGLSGTATRGIGNDLPNQIFGGGFLYGAEGNDSLFGRFGDDVLNGGIGADRLDGNIGGLDLASYSLATGGVRASLLTPSANTGEAAGDVYISIDGIIGSSFADDLSGDNNGIRLNGLGGADTISGGTDNDGLLGGEGNDLMNGNLSNDTLLGEAGNDTLIGGSGMDWMSGNAGDDIMIVSDASDQVLEASGQGADSVFTGVTYTLAAGQSIEHFGTASIPGTSSISLTGNEVAQTIDGNSGNNILNGLGGSDTISPGGGSDQVVFTSFLGAGNVDMVVGFSVPDDTFWLDDAIFGALGATVEADELVIGPAAADANDFLIYNSVTGALFYDADGSGATAAVQFAALATGLPLTSSDFAIV
ncbi:hypothetical protein BH10PSE7_BH10PSE7_34100 [soil metagenome]